MSTLMGSRILGSGTSGEQVVVLGLCPGCDAWQVDYTDDVAQQWMVPGWDAETSSVVVITDLWYDVIETAIREHMEDCPHLRDLVDLYD